MSAPSSWLPVASEDAAVIKHHFSSGVYAKETRIPAGQWLVSHAHEFDHLSILASGTVEVIVEDSRRIIEGPSCLTIQAKKHHGVKAITDSVWFCVHATECVDESEVDQILISSVNAPEIERIVHCLGV
jgi:quercetin dioxygenase-like cupin family protein